MIPIITPKEMYLLDDYLINYVKIDSKLLMENAAVYIYNKIVEFIPLNSNILVLCGTGNNGGDGLALIRHLKNDYNIEFAIIGDKNRQSIDNKYNYDVLQALQIIETKEDEINYEKYDCIIDSIYGIGGKTPLNSDIEKLITKVNRLQLKRIAIDVPTGLNSETGIANNPTFNADYTFTMYAVKTGLLLNDGKDFTGKIECLSLGVPKDLINSFAKINKFDEYKPLIRKHNSSKFDYGKCAIIAGSTNMPGAAALACNAAISSGAGLVYLITTKVHPSIYPEVICFNIDDYDLDSILDPEIQSILTNVDSIIIGPGLGNSNNINLMVKHILNSFPSKKFIIDADGIRTLDYNSVYNKNITITPHLGEFARLLDKNRYEISKNIIELVKHTSEKMNINILLKGTTSIISNGEDVYLVSDGVPELATAGSGDVLSGILGAHINHNIKNNSLESIANATLLHILAAKKILDTSNSIIASDIIKGLKCLK